MINNQIIIYSGFFPTMIYNDLQTINNSFKTHQSPGYGSRTVFCQKRHIMYKKKTNTDTQLSK